MSELKLAGRTEELPPHGGAEGRRVCGPMPHSLADREHPVVVGGGQSVLFPSHPLIVVFREAALPSGPAARGVAQSALGIDP